MKILLALAFWIFVSAAAAWAQVKSMGEVSFAVPAGWEYELRPGDNHATLTLSKGGNIWVMAVFTPLRSSGDPDADFRAAWTQDVRSMSVPEPVYEHKGTAGYQGREGSQNTPDGSRHVFMYVLEADHTAIPVLVISPSRAMFNELLPVISEFVEGIRSGPFKAQAPKTNITIADLVGEWHTGGDSSVNYVDSNTGAYAGSSTVAHSAGYVIAANGTFTQQFAGISNRNIIRGKSAGTVELTSEFIVFKEKPGNRVTRYRFVSYQMAVNGSTVLTLLP